MDTIGLDLHKRETQLCTLTEHGELIEHVLALPPVAVHVPLAGSYSSALEPLLSKSSPAATRTMPLGSRVAV